MHDTCSGRLHISLFFFCQLSEAIRKPGATLHFVSGFCEWQIDKQWVLGDGTLEVVRWAVSWDKCMAMYFWGVGTKTWHFITDVQWLSGKHGSEFILNFEDDELQQKTRQMPLCWVQGLTIIIKTGHSEVVVVMIDSQWIGESSAESKLVTVEQPWHHLHWTIWMSPGSVAA